MDGEHGPVESPNLGKILSVSHEKSVAVLGPTGGGPAGGAGKALHFGPTGATVVGIVHIVVRSLRVKAKSSGGRTELEQAGQGRIPDDGGRVDLSRSASLAERPPGP